MLSVQCAPNRCGREDPKSERTLPVLSCANYNFRWLVSVFYNGNDQTQIHVNSLIIASMAPANPPTMAPFNRIY